MLRNTVMMLLYTVTVMLLSDVFSEVVEVDTREPAADAPFTGNINSKVSAFDSYLKLFQHNRAIQLDAVKSIQTFGTKYEQRYKLVDTMVIQMFKVLEEGKNNLTSWGFVPGDPFPENDTIRESVSKVLENTAMFGDLILRLPDITHAIYDRKKEWEFVIGWAVWFSMESQVFQGANLQLLNLMSQELGLIPKEDNYVNPFKESSNDQDIEDFEIGEQERKKKAKNDKKKKKTKEKRKGPKLAGTQHTEL